jgi:hypothetical protein
LGPDLTDIGRRRGLAFLAESIVKPDAFVPNSFRAVRLISRFWIRHYGFRVALFAPLLPASKSHPIVSPGAVDKHCFAIARNHVPDEVVDAHFVARLRVYSWITGSHKTSQGSKSRLGAC